MIKFQMFEAQKDVKDVCYVDDDNDVGTFVVPVSDYMRAYFNYKILLKGDNFRIPRSAGYLQVSE